jgi:hypothetical protein
LKPVLSNVARPVRRTASRDCALFSESSRLPLAGESRGSVAPANTAAMRAKSISKLATAFRLFDLGFMASLQFVKTHPLSQVVLTSLRKLPYWPTIVPSWLSGIHLPLPIY